MSPEEFKAWRKRMGWTQAQAGDALGLSRVHIGFLERGVHPISRAAELATKYLELRKNKLSILVMSPDEFKAWRKRMEWTQEQAGEALGLSKEHILRLEQGKFSISRAIVIASNCLENHNT